MDVVSVLKVKCILIFVLSLAIHPCKSQTQDCNPLPFCIQGLFNQNCCTNVEFSFEAILKHGDNVPLTSTPKSDETCLYVLRNESYTSKYSGCRIQSYDFYYDYACCWSAQPNYQSNIGNRITETTSTQRSTTTRETRKPFPNTGTRDIAPVRHPPRPDEYTTPSRQTTYRTIPYSTTTLRTTPYRTTTYRTTTYPTTRTTSYYTTPYKTTTSRTTTLRTTPYLTKTYPTTTYRTSRITHTTPYRTTTYRTTPYHTTTYRTTTYRTTPHHTSTYRTTTYRTTPYHTSTYRTTTYRTPPHHTSTYRTTTYRTTPYRTTQISELNLLPNECGISLRGAPSGNSTSKLDFPWMALLVYGTAEGLRFECEGTIIHKLFILTSARCLLNRGDSKLLGVRVGQHDISDEEGCRSPCLYPYQDINMQLAIPHDQYNNTHNNIGLIKLEKSIIFRDNAVPICLPKNENLSQKSPVAVSSWGAAKKGLASMKVFVSQAKVDTKACRSYDNRLCVKSNEDASVCGFGSGAPLQAKGQNNIFTQLGIGSVVPDSCTIDSTLLFTDVFLYMDWIIYFIKLHGSS